MKNLELPDISAPGIVVLLALLVYLNSFPGSFIVDDVQIVRDNPLVADIDLKTIFTTDYWGPWENSGLYRPVTILSHALNRRVFGTHIFFHHLTNVLLHAAVSLLLYLLLSAARLRKEEAFLGAALFAVHPIHGEAVNVVVGRAELLAALFIFSGLYAALRRLPRHGALTPFFFAAALLSKESAIALLPLLLVLDLFENGDIRRLLRERRMLYLSLAGVALTWLVLRTWVLSLSPVPPDVIYEADNPLLGLAPLPRILTAIKLQMIYLRKLLVPYPLLAVYSGNTVGVIDSLLSAPALAAVSFVFLLAAVVTWGWKNRQAYALGMALYLAAFPVTANLFILLQVVMAERLAYLPSAGFSLAAGSLLLLGGRALGGPRRRLVSLAPGVAAVVVLAAMTIARNPEFGDPIRIWEATVRKQPASARGWYNLATEYELDGRKAEVEKAFLKAMEADPAFPDTYGKYAAFLIRADRPAEALETAMRKVELLPNAVSTAHLLVARAYLKLDDPEAALEWLGKVAPYFARSLDFQEVRALSLDALGREQEAMEIYQVIHNVLKSPEVAHRLAVMLMNGGMFRQAERVLRDRLAHGELADTYNLLGISFSLQGRGEETIKAFERAAALDPSSPMYRENLERARTKFQDGQGEGKETPSGAFRQAVSPAIQG